MYKYSSLYNLQYVHGDLSFLNKINTIYPFTTVPLMIYAVIHYNAIGASIAWFVIRLLHFIFITPIIHHIFIKGYHFTWLKKNIIPYVIITSIYLYFLSIIPIPFESLSRIETFSSLIFLGLILLTLNGFASKDIRTSIKDFSNKLNFLS